MKRSRAHPPHGIRTAAVGLFLLVFAAGCAPRPQAGPRWPDGVLLVARTEGLARLLAPLAALEGTPLARHARRLASSLPDCDVVEARSEAGSFAEAASQLVCRPAESTLALLHEELGERDLAFALPQGPTGRVHGSARIDPSGDVDLDLSIPHDIFDDPRRLMLPGANETGPALLSRDGELVHARVRPDGRLDIAAFVPDDSQANLVFGLKNELFTGVVLDGTWEAAIYLPEVAGAMPRAALALGFSHRHMAVTATERFLLQLQDRWHVQRSRISVGDATGACLLELRILPELAPCYVATDHALVVGWNPASLRQALGEADPSRPAAPDRPAELGSAGGQLVVDLARIVEANALLGNHRGDHREGGAEALPWRRAVAEGQRVGDRIRLRVRLERRGAGV